MTLAASDITVKLIEVVPTVLWVGAALVVVFLFRDVIQQLLRKPSRSSKRATSM